MRWVLATVSLGIALLGGEAVCRLVLPRPGFVAVNGNAFPGAIAPHPSRLFQLAPNYSGVVRRGTFGDMRFETNADGLRDRPLGELRQATMRVLAVGNSFTFGVGIPREDTWPVHLEHTLRQRWPAPSLVVINAGVPAYGLAQIRDLTEELLPRLDPQLVILGVFAGGIDRMRDPFTALHDFVVRKSFGPNVRIVNGGLVASRFSRPRAAAVDLWLQTHFYLGAYLFEAANELRGKIRDRIQHRRVDRGGLPQRSDSIASLNAGLQEIARIRRDVDHRGSRLLVVTSAGFDQQNRIYPPQAEVISAVKHFCDSAGIAFLDPTAQLEASGATLRVSPGDWHLSAAANGVFADYLAASLISQRSLLTAPASQSRRASRSQ